MVVRYSKDQRPTTLPIQPFTFQHQFVSKPLQPKPLLPLLSGYISEIQVHSSSGSDSGDLLGEESEGAAENVDRFQHPVIAPPPGSVRPSPLGSYSPAMLQGLPSSGTCSMCTSSPQPPHNFSYPLSAALGPPRTPTTGKQGRSSVQLPFTAPPTSQVMKREAAPQKMPTVQRHCDTLDCLESGNHMQGSKVSVRIQNGMSQNNYSVSFILSLSR